MTCRNIKRKTMFDRIRLQFSEYFPIYMGSFEFYNNCTYGLEPDIVIFTEEITDSNNSLVMELGLNPNLLISSFLLSFHLEFIGI